MAIYPIVLTQQTFTHQDNLTYPFEERGLQFGDGIYEVIRIYNGSYYLLNEHVDRLFRSLDAVKIKLPATKEEITDLLLHLLEKNEMTSDGKVYLQVTRGSAPRDHVFPADVPANLYAYVQDLPRHLENLQKGVSTITEPDVRWENCYIKSLNLLPNVLAKQEAKEQGCYEAILHRDDLVTECSSSNIYIVKNGVIYTHPATNRILHGCVRMRVEKFATDLSISFNESGFTKDDLFDADEVFLSSSTSEVMPVIRINQKQIQDGTPGPITRKLQQEYERDANITENNITHSL
ncbi:D-amino-acid transaminase [Virgibacillus salexigens]|uniref:D-alanine aminotransferase n=2 Tax=Virgibacillus TaxID=84406 RepID=A0A024QEY8_9BACI|nr:MULTISPECIES: D-amino-acid transaminase [Virgibacillus]MYL42884.1 D-amino-acid transaminase [Virgibacillus massiliensis]GGJ70311.1 D-alanine aminotransferase [Virgibacillus kapii]CDQ40780.1 D-alanine aminotransferase [Virgibacillus massiliensis]